MGADRLLWLDVVTVGSAGGAMGPGEPEPGPDGELMAAY